MRRDVLKSRFFALLLGLIVVLSFTLSGSSSKGDERKTQTKGALNQTKAISTHLPYEKVNGKS